MAVRRSRGCWLSQRRCLEDFLCLTVVHDGGKVDKENIVLEKLLFNSNVGREGCAERFLELTSWLHAFNVWSSWSSFAKVALPRGLAWQSLPRAWVLMFVILLS